VNYLVHDNQVKYAESSSQHRKRVAPPCALLELKLYGDDHDLIHTLTWKHDARNVSVIVINVGKSSDICCAEVLAPSAVWPPHSRTAERIARQGSRISNIYIYRFDA
jgi:hypothetical protein